LSNGQRARASCARNLRSFRAIDNFAATVDEANANCMAGGLAKIVRRERLKNVVVATTRRGVPAWSQADWCLVLGDDDTRLIFNPGTPLERPRVTVTMVATETDEAYARTLLAPVATAATRREPILARSGRISVDLDGRGRIVAVKRENAVPVPSAGVGSAPSSAAMAWLTPGFLSIRLWASVQ
jgi:hypothetical protein